MLMMLSKGGICHAEAHDAGLGQWLATATADAPDAGIAAADAHDCRADAHDAGLVRCLRCN